MFSEQRSVSSQPAFFRAFSLKSLSSVAVVPVSSAEILLISLLQMAVVGEVHIPNIGLTVVNVVCNAEYLDDRSIDLRTSRLLSERSAI